MILVFCARRRMCAITKHQPLSRFLPCHGKGAAWATHLKCVSSSLNLVKSCTPFVLSFVCLRNTLITTMIFHFRQSSVDRLVPSTVDNNSGWAWVSLFVSLPMVALLMIVRFSVKKKLYKYQVHDAFIFFACVCTEDFHL